MPRPKKSKAEKPAAQPVAPAEGEEVVN